MRRRGGSTPRGATRIFRGRPDEDRRSPTIETTAWFRSRKERTIPSKTERPGAGDDAHKFVFRFVDELLYRFTGESVACRTVSVNLRRAGPGGYAATVSTTGEKFDLTKHPQGTEVKAMTYSEMQIHGLEKEADGGNGKVDLFVIVDI